MTKPDKSLKSLKPPKRDTVIAGNLDLVVTAHAALTQLGYKDIEIADLLETASFLAGGE